MSEKYLTIHRYYVKNVNDFPSGMVLLLDLLITGNWHVWMDVKLVSIAKLHELMHGRSPPLKVKDRE